MKNATDFGLSTSASSAANAAALQAALAAGPVYLPAGVYLCDQIVATATPVIVGDGMASQMVSTSSTSAICVNAIAENRGMILRDFQITPQQPNQGTRGIEIVTAKGGYVCDWTIDNVTIGPFGGPGLALDNGVNNVDGIFTGVVRRGQISNGILGVNIGDRITFSELVVCGQGIAINLSSVPGACLVKIEGCTLVTQGGALALAGMTKCLIRDCEIEHPAYLGDYNGPLQTMVSLYNCLNCDVRHNRITASHGGAGPNGPILGANYDVVIQGKSTYCTVDWNMLGPANAATTANVSGPTNVIGTNNLAA